MLLSWLGIVVVLPPWWLGLVVMTVVVGAVPHCVEILDAGVLPLIKGHIGVQFYVTVNNRGPDPTEVQVTAVQCCEDLPGGQSDCSDFQLIPETRVMQPNTTRNFTLIHPTLYAHDRRGECLVGMHYTTSCNRSKEARHHIAFDTSLTEDNIRCNMLRGYSENTIDVSPCHSYDEDVLDGCQMVDCHKKYFGLKSFFNRGTRLCEPVPACLPTRRRGMPDTVYDVTTNQCRDLAAGLCANDLQHLSHADLEPECSPGDSAKMPFVNCHHGRLSNVTGDCECDRGFRHAAMPEEPGNPRTQVFHSCNLVGSCWSLGRFFTLPERHVWVTALVLSLVVVLLDLCLVWGTDST